MKGGFPLPLLAFLALLFLFRILSSLDLDPDLQEDLPFFLMVGAFILFRALSSQTEKKRRGPVPAPVPTPETKAETIKRELGFKIPTLRNAPKDVQVQAQAEDQITDDELDALRRDSYERHLAEKQAREEKLEQERLQREHQNRETQTARRETSRFSPDALRNAVIWSEIMAPPKALRRR